MVSGDAVAMAGPSGTGVRIFSWAVVLAVLLGVGALVWASLAPSWETLPVGAVAASAAGDEITVEVRHGACRADPEVRVLSSSVEHVAIEARHDVSGDCEDVGLVSDLIIDLDEPLGDRRVAVAALQSDARCVIDERASDRCVGTLPGP